MAKDAAIKRVVWLDLTVLSNELIVLRDIGDVFQELVEDEFRDLGLEFSTDTEKRDQALEDLREARARFPGCGFMWGPVGVDITVAAAGAGGVLTVLAQILKRFVDRYRVQKLHITMPDGTSVSFEDARIDSIERVLAQLKELSSPDRNRPIAAEGSEPDSVTEASPDAGSENPPPA